MVITYLAFHGIWEQRKPIRHRRWSISMDFVIPLCLAIEVWNLFLFLFPFKDLRSNPNFTISLTSLTFTGVLHPAFKARRFAWDLNHRTLIQRFACISKHDAYSIPYLDLWTEAFELPSFPFIMEFSPFNPLEVRRNARTNIFCSGYLFT